MDKKPMTTVEFEGTSFNVDHLSTLNKEDFVKEFSGMDHIFPGYSKTQKTELLGEAYKQIKAAAKAPEEVSAHGPVSGGNSETNVAAPGKVG